MARRMNLMNLLPVDAHVHYIVVPILIQMVLMKQRVQFDTGLLFIFQKDLTAIRVQTNLGAQDKMNEYITHAGSGLFACFGGVKKENILVKKLFE